MWLGVWQCQSDSYQSSRQDETQEDFFIDIEDVGVAVDIDIVDGRIDHPQSRTMLCVEPVDEDGELICVRLETNHHSFSRGRSVTIRPFHRFYSLQRLHITRWYDNCNIICW